MNGRNSYNPQNKRENSNKLSNNQGVQIQAPPMPSFWKNDNKEEGIDEKLFTDYAYKLAKVLFNETKTSKNLNKPSQIRKFYDELLRIKSLRNNFENFKNFKAYIAMIKPKVAYSLGRKLVSENFYQFISEGIKRSEDYESFDIFLNVFEATIAYYKKLNPED